MIAFGVDSRMPVTLRSPSCVSDCGLIVARSCDLVGVGQGVVEGAMDVPVGDSRNCGPKPHELADPGLGGPAATVNRHFLPDGLGEVMSDVPPVADLEGIGQRLTHGCCKASGTVSADDLDARMLTQPPGKGSGPEVGQDIDPLTSLSVDQDGGIGPTAPMTRPDRPENTTPTSWLISSTSQRDRATRSATTERATEPNVGQTPAALRGAFDLARVCKRDRHPG